MSTTDKRLEVYDVVAQVAPGAYTADPSAGADVNHDDDVEVGFLVHVGTWTDGTFTIGVEEADPTTPDGDTADTYADVDAADVFDVDGNLDANGELVVSDGSFDDSGVIIKYRGSKKFVRVTVTVTGSPTTGATLSIVALKYPRHENTTPIVRN